MSTGVTPASNAGTTKRGPLTEHSEDAVPVRPAGDDLVERQVLLSLEAVWCIRDASGRFRVQHAEEAVGGCGASDEQRTLDPGQNAACLGWHPQSNSA